MIKKYNKSLRYDLYGNMLAEGEYYSKAKGRYEYKYIDAAGNRKSRTSKTLLQLREIEQKIINGVDTGRRQKSFAGFSASKNNQSLTENMILSKEQESLLLDYVKSNYSWFYPMIKLQICTGIRTNELLALKQKNINFEQKYVIVTHKISKIKRAELNDMEFIKIAERKIKFDEEMKAVLLCHIEIVQSLYEDFNLWRIPCEERFLFINEKRKPIGIHSYTRMIGNIIKAYNHRIDTYGNEESYPLSYLPHISTIWLRRTGFARMAENGDSPDELQRIAGYTNIKSVFIYYT